VNEVEALVAYRSEAATKNKKLKQQLVRLDIPCWLLDIEYTPFEKGLTCKTASSGANRQAMRMPWPKG
jgi:hypothetical protein